MKAVHKSFDDEIVTFRKLKNGDVAIKFSNGEKSTMSAARFNELFKVL